MAYWSEVPLPLSYGTSDGNWSTLELAIGDPKQRIYALHSSRGVALEVPFSSLCGEEQAAIFPRSSHEGPLGPGLSYNLTTFDPAASKDWISGSGCEQGSDYLTETILQLDEFDYNSDGVPVYTDDSQIARMAFRVPVRHLRAVHTPGLDPLTPLLGFHALPDRWAGSRDYWWDALVGTPKTLFQNLPLDAVRRLRPNLAYGFTAGALYRGTTAKLTVNSEFLLMMGDQRITSKFSLDDDRLLNVDILDLILIGSAVTSHGTETSLVKSARLPAILDTTDPFLELPDDICFQIAQELGLSYDEPRNLFLMGDETLARLRLRQPALRITLGARGQDSPDYDESITVTLPFGAFDHFLRFPDKTERYFPIRISHGADVVLGRTLFQETYLSVDYARQSFVLAKVTTQPLPWYKAAIPYRATSMPGADFWSYKVWSYASYVSFSLFPLVLIFAIMYEFRSMKLTRVRARKRELRQLWMEKHGGESDKFKDSRRLKRVLVALMPSILMTAVIASAVAGNRR